MTEAPSGWVRTTLGEVATLIRNGLFASRPTDDATGTRILRISAVRHGRVDLTESKHVSGLSAEQIQKYSLQQDDLLFTRYNGSRSLVGISGLVPRVADSVIHPDKLIRVTLPDEVDPRFVNFQMEAASARAHIEGRIKTTAGQSGISGADLRSTPLLLPDLEEQRRIVDILEDHLSRLDAAQEYLASSRRLLAVAHRAILSQIIPNVASYPPDWETSTVGDAGLVELGRQRHPDWHTGPNMRPYLRVANVFEDEIRTDDLKEMHWPGETFERFKVRPGDILLNEGQTPDLLGRPALYRGDPAEVAFTNSLIRFQAKASVLPEFALLVFRRHMHAKRFKRESRITTNIAHLSAARLKTVEFPIPALEEQRRLVAQADSLLDSNRRVREGIAQAEARGAALRRAILSAAFAGGLTGRPGDLDSVVELATTGVSA